MIPLDLLNIFTVNLTSKTGTLDHSNVLLPPFSAFHQWLQSQQAISGFVSPKFNPQMLCAHLFLDRCAVPYCATVCSNRSHKRSSERNKSVLFSFWNFIKWHFGFGCCVISLSFNHHRDFLLLDLKEICSLLSFAFLPAMLFMASARPSGLYKGWNFTLKR